MILPEFQQFPNFGQGLPHVLAIAIIYLLGLGHGRKRAMRELERRRHASPPPA